MKVLDSSRKVAKQVYLLVLHTSRALCGYIRRVSKSARAALTKSYTKAISIIRRLLSTLYGLIYVKLYPVKLRPARWLYGVTQWHETYAAELTIIESFNSYPIPNHLRDVLNEQKAIIKLLDESIQSGRESLFNIAMNRLKSIEMPKPADFFEEKAVIERNMNIKIPYSVSIGEWKSYINLIRKHYEAVRKQNM